MPFEANPVAAFTLIAAPAVLTNAVALLILSTSNRFSRTLDRARSLSAQLEGSGLAVNQRRLRTSQFERAQVRTFLLLRALSLFYLSLGIMAVTTVLSVLGISVTAFSNNVFEGGMWIGVMAVAFGVLILALGCIYLVRETRLAAESIKEEANFLRSSFITGDIQASNAD